ncbi:MAG: metallophosphoesterase [Gammaproteobacteria bacterium]
MKSDKNYSDRVRIWLRRILYTFIALIVIYGVGRFIDVSLGSFYSGTRAPYLQMVGSNQATLQWQTAEPEQGVVRFGSNLRNLKNTVVESNTDVIHKVQLVNLKPATRYFYSVGTHQKIFKGGTKDDWFVTAPIVGTATAVRFWVLGDPGDWKRGIFDVRDAAYQWLRQNPRVNKDGSSKPDLDFIITTGDNAYRSGTNKQFQKAVFAPFADVLRNYSYWPVYGNHDARRWAFYNLFTFPIKGELGGVASNTERYYAFDYAKIHFVFLDTTDSDLSTDSRMLNWLKRDLHQTKQQWLIAVFHHPPYSKGTHDSDNPRDSWGRLVDTRENILPILEQYGVDLVLTGHSHMYERSYLINCHYGNSSSLSDNMILDSSPGNANKPYAKYSEKLAPHEGTVYVVAGSSSKVDQGPLDHPANVVNLLELGSMIVEIKDNRLDAKFINDKMQVLDNFSIIKGQSINKSIATSCVKK